MTSPGDVDLRVDILTGTDSSSPSHTGSLRSMSLSPPSAGLAGGGERSRSSCPVPTGVSEPFAPCKLGMSVDQAPAHLAKRGEM